MPLTQQGGIMPDEKHSLPSDELSPRRQKRIQEVPTVFVLLVNYCGVENTLACLHSLMTLNYPHFKTVVIDNGSPDTSVEMLERATERYAFHLIVSPDNLGFSGGNNLGIDYALAHGADYIWLLNNDTTIDPHALTHLVNESERTGGLTGSLLLYPDRTYQQVGTRIRWFSGQTRGVPEKDLKDRMPVPTLSGASMLIPTEVIRRIGKLDPSYFLYFEDGEYCLRASKKRYPVTVSLRSRVYHKEGASTGKRSLTSQYYYQRNRLKMLMAYASPASRLTIGLYTLIRLIRSAVKALLCFNERAHEKQISAKVHWFAVMDYVRGVNGPCPHPVLHP